MEELIPILIAAGALVLQYLVSDKKKKKQQSQQTMSENFPDFSEMFPFLGKDDDEKAEETVTIEDMVKEYISPVELPEPKLRYMPLGAAPEIEGGRLTKSDKLLEDMRGRVEPIEPEVKNSEHENDEPLKDFDIRKAIIYNEILQPKFKE
jgi:hypothetical protein